MPPIRKPAGSPLPSWLHLARLAVLALPVAWVLQQAIFGASGWLALRHKQQQYAQERAQIQTLQVQNRALNHSIRALRSNPQAIEGIAREQLHLTRPGEIVYTYPVAAQAPTTADAALR